MKQIKLLLKNNIVEVLNKDTLYLEPDEDVEIFVQNPVQPGDELFISAGMDTIKVADGRTMINEKLLKDGNIKFTLKSAKAKIPDFFVWTPKIKNLKVIGETLDEKYPEIIEHLFKEIQRLKKVNLLLNTRITKLERKGVIE
jgi:hypothetical protein